jgi:phytanoyl-CoA hydroxylase
MRGWRKRRSEPFLSAVEQASFREEGFLILPSLLSGDEVDLVNDTVDRVWNDRSIYNNATISARTGAPGYCETYVRHVDHGARAESYKLNHLYLYEPRLLSLLMAPKIRERIGGLLGGTPLLFNSLNLEWGSEQRFHFDTFYMAPRKPGRMVVIWLALEDIVEGSGPLQYYPRSHLIEPYRFSHGDVWAVEEEMPAFDEYIQAEIKQRGLEPQKLYPKRGDAFLWHAQLYHGGSAIEANASRKSMVAHFWRAEDLPPDWVQEVPGGGTILRREHMFVAGNFDEGARDAAGR